MSEPTWAQQVALRQKAEAQTPASPSGLDRLAQIRPEQAEALLTLALGIVEDAGDLWRALDHMSLNSDARPAIEIVTHHAIEAAVALLDESVGDVDT